MAANRARTASHHGRPSLHRLGRWLGLALMLCLSAAAVTPAQQALRPRDALRSAIDTYKRGDYESAAVLFAQAQQRQSELDPSERVDLDNFGTQNVKALTGRQEGASQIRRAEEALNQGRAADAAKLASAATTNPYLAKSDQQVLANLKTRMQQASTVAVKGDPKALLAAARNALKQGDLNGADKLAADAEQAGGGTSWMQPWADTPAKVHRDVQAARAKAGPTEPAKAPTEVPNRPMLTQAQNVPLTGKAPPTGPSLAMPLSDKKAMARQMLAEGYKALQRDDLVTARKMAEQVRDLHVEFDRNELGADQLLHEIQKRSTATAKTAKTPAEARAMVKEAKALVKNNKIDEAEQLCNQASAVPNVHWGLFEDSPEKVRGDILKARTTQDRDESVKMMAEARKLFANGQFDDAKKKAWLAEKMHGPYGVLDFGDRPQKLLAEIAKAEGNKGPAIVQKKDPPLPKGPDIAKIDPLVAQQNGQRARSDALIREARDLDKRGMLVEAWAKALEAKKLSVVYAPGQDSWEKLMFDLRAEGKSRIEVTLFQVTDSVSAKPGDQDRVQKAQTDLANARQLAMQFGLDTVAVDQRSAWLKQTAGSAGVNLPGDQVVQVGYNSGNSNQKVGLDKLEQARLELRHGNCAGARKLAEEAYDTRYGVQKQAEAVLLDIDAEEHNQKLLVAQRTFNAGLDAFLAGNHKLASSILVTVEVQHLQPPQQARLREIMATREMDPGVMQAGAKNVLKPTPTERPGVAVASDKADEPIDHVRAMEKVQYEAMQQHNREAMTTAMGLFKAGQESKALDVLSAQIGQIDLAGLAPEPKRQLKLPLEKRMQEFRTLQAQKLLSAQKSGSDPKGWDEGNYQKQINKQQEQVADIVKQCNALNKEGKYQDALALAYKGQAIDPDNQALTAIVFSNNILINTKKYDADKKQNEEFFLNAMGGSNGPFPDDNDPFKVGPEARSRLQNRGKNALESIQSQTRTPAEKKIEYRLDQPIHFGFHDTPLRDVITALGNLSGIPVYPDERALNEANINQSQPLTMDSNGLAMKSALNILLDKMKLTYVIRENALLITTSEKAKDNFKRVVYPIADLIVPVENHQLPETMDLTAIMQRLLDSQMQQYRGPVPLPTNLGLPPAAPVSSPGSGVATSPWAASQSQAQMTSFNPVQKRLPGQTMEDLLMDLIKGTIQPHSWKDMGGPGTVQYYPLGMALIVNQVQEVQGEVLDLLAALRRLQDMEIAIEMRLVSVSELFYERIGVDFSVNLKTPMNPGAENQLLNSSFAPFGTVNRNLGVTGVISGLTPAGTLTPDLNFPIKPSSFNFSVPPFGGYTAPGVDGGLSLGLAFLSDIQVFMLLEAAQGDSRTNIMQAPKITVFNGQTAFISVNTTQFLNLGIIPIQQSNGQVLFQPQNTPVPIGVFLTVTPVVSADRRFVRLNLRPTLNNFVSNNIPVFPVQVQIPNSVDGPLGLQVPVGQPAVVNTFFIQQPQISNITLNTTVNVPDGGTVLLGGLKTMSEGRNEAGPPILSKIPYLSRLFRNVGWGRDGQSLMILVTPRIIINEEEEQIFLGNIAPVPRQ